MSISRPLGVLSLALVVASCAAEPPLRWEVVFADESLAARTAVVVVEIREGGCSGASWTGYGAEIAPGETAPAVPSLAAGTWGFAGRARDSGCARIADGCTAIELPTHEATVVTTLVATAVSPDCDPSDCTSGICVPSIRDAGGVDAASRDAGRDAGGLPGDDAGRDGGGVTGDDAGPDASMCSCAGRECGGNGCGTSCGSCSGAGSTCMDGQCCVRDRSGCGLDEDCCGGHCTDGECCAASGDDCVDSSGCCADLVCTGGVCCVETSESCTTSTECCSGRCGGGARCCVPLAATCRGAADCCTPLTCQGGRCCEASGTVCAMDVECCSGSCTTFQCD